MRESLNLNVVSFLFLIFVASRMVNVDHLHVGWYQSAHFGNFLSPQLLESHFAYQTSIDESVKSAQHAGKEVSDVSHTN